MINALFLVALGLAFSTAANAQIDLGSAATFGILAAQGITNVGSSSITGDLGISPGTAVTEGEELQVSGTRHIDDDVAAQAQLDANTAFNDPGDSASTVALLALGDTTLIAGTYTLGAAAINGPLVLDGEGVSDGVWIFRISSSLTTATGSTVTLSNGAQSCNVFWQVGSSATLQGSTFAGNVLALVSITVNTPELIDGALFALTGAITLSNDDISVGVCDVVPTGIPPPPPTLIPPTIPVPVTEPPSPATTDVVPDVTDADPVTTIAPPPGDPPLPPDPEEPPAPTDPIPVPTDPEEPVSPGDPIEPEDPLAPGDPIPLLPGGPVEPGDPIPANPEEPVAPGEPLPANPEGPVATDAPVLPGAPDLPVAPGAPDIPVVPGAPDAPVVPGAPGAPLVPLVPGAPDAPLVPVVPGAPDAPLVPVVPGAPDAPLVPVVPGAPDAPLVPVVPGAPDVPVVPGAPEAPGLTITPGSPPRPPFTDTIPNLPGVPTIIPSLPGLSILPTDIIENSSEDLSTLVSTIATLPVLSESATLAVDEFGAVNSGSRTSLVTGPATITESGTTLTVPSGSTTQVVLSSTPTFESGSSLQATDVLLSGFLSAPTASITDVVTAFSTRPDTAAATVNTLSDANAAEEFSAINEKTATITREVMYVVTATCTGPTTITTHAQTFTIPTPCTTVLTCTPEPVTEKVVVFTTNCPVVPTTVVTAEETFVVETTGLHTLSCTNCARKLPTVTVTMPDSTCKPTATVTEAGLSCAKGGDKVTVYQTKTVFEPEPEASVLEDIRVGAEETTALIDTAKVGGSSVPAVETSAAEISDSAIPASSESSAPAPPNEEPADPADPLPANPGEVDLDVRDADIILARGFPVRDTAEFVLGSGARSILPSLLIPLGLSIIALAFGVALA
ncbi:MAG: hypothetical protein M1837_000672 [Sclerophora amabilis]|nr:MAG: hypothetical protein M1837_000672 [Sclerophora amabilis]